jgi:hypothetical protein
MGGLLEVRVSEGRLRLAATAGSYTNYERQQGTYPKQRPADGRLQLWPSENFSKPFCFCNRSQALNVEA